MTTLAKSKVSNAVNVPDGVIVPQLRETVLKEGDLEARRVYRQRERVVLALMDTFVQNAFRKAGDRFTLLGEEEINDEVLRVESDTPAMEAILRPVLEKTTAKPAPAPKPAPSSIANELPIPDSSMAPPKK